MEQYVVINIEKTQTISAVLERHILRVDIHYENGKKIVKAWTPDNADASKAMLNRELVSRAYVDSLTGQTKMRTIDQAIRHRIEEAGIKKLRPGQNTALEIILTGSPETLNSLDEEGLEKWVNESMDWAGKTWGKKNIVTAVLHRDEKTPHIHMIVVPIVKGLSRRSKARDEMLRRAGKKAKTRNRNITGNRLSANEVYTQPRLYAYHTSYAKEVGAHFGLKRGVRGEKGSRQNPQKSIDYNRELERQRLEMETMIAQMRSDYSEKQEELQTVTESLAIAQANLQLATEAATREEEKRKNAKKEADEEDARLQEVKRLTVAEQVKYEALQETGLHLSGVIKTMEETIERGRDLESQIVERENYFRSLGSMSLWVMLSKIPELIKKELTEIVNKYFKGEVIAYREREVLKEDGETTKNEKFYEMKMKWDGGKEYILGVLDRDASAWINGKRAKLSNGDGISMPEIVSYITRGLTAAGKELVTSLYRKTDAAPVKDDSVVIRLKKKYGDVTVSSVTPLMTNGKQTGRMYLFTAAGKKRTAVSDYEAKEICICPGHAKKGAFYLENWTTIGGKPAVAVNNRVYSREFKKLLKGPSIG